MARSSIVICFSAALIGCSPPTAQQPSPQQPAGESASAPVAEFSKEEKLAAVVERLKAERASLLQLETTLRTDTAAAKKANDAAVAKEDEDLYTAKITAATGKDPEREMQRWNELKKQVAARRTAWETQHKDSIARWDAAIKAQAALVKEVQAERDALDPTLGKQEAEALAAAAKAASVPLASASASTDARMLDDKEAPMTLKTLTSHQYAIGVGEGDGAGFGGRSSRAKVRFIRLEYPGGDWQQDAELNSDLNLLIEYHVQTGIKISEQPETMLIRRLGNFKGGMAPPLVYMTGSKSIDLDKQDVVDLRRYLVEQSGMLFLDDGGGDFHDQTMALMKRIVPDIEPQRIPLDDIIHAVPNELKFIPYVAPHGGRDPYGWKFDGRWIAYYHPGDIGDAWADGHAGVEQKVWKAAYNLGVNIMNYAYSENAKWRAARGIRD